jgi:hypothetical protein
MKKNLIILISVCFLISTVSFSQTDKIIDLNFISTELPKLHYNLFHKMSEEEFNKEIEVLKTRAANLSELEFVLQLQVLIAKLGDSHTGIGYTKFLDKKKSYPLKLYWLKDGFYVIATHREYENLLGLKLSAINGIPINEILKRFEQIIVKDNDAMLKHRVPNILPAKEILDFFEITNTVSNLFEFDNGDKIIKTPIKTSAEFNNPRDYVQLEPAAIPLSLQNKREMFWFKYLEDKNTLYAQYNRCWSKELEQRYGSEERASKLPSFKAFSDSLVKNIKDYSPIKLIFDMRFNPGGSSQQGTELVNELSKMDEINQDGKIFVIIGRRTFSSAVINAMNFKEETKAILIGESTSGAPNHFGEVKSMVLPETEIRVSYSTKYFKYTDDDASTIIPDVRVEITIEDLMNGKDTILEYIDNI